jgi:hypothetical protein
MGWKYIEGGSGKKKLGESDVREHFGVQEKGCPVVELANGWIACWTAAPLGAPADYPALSHAPKGKDTGFKACQ